MLSDARVPRNRVPAACAKLKQRRPLLRMARPGRESRLADALAAEEKRERRADARYWAPLKSELEALRLERVRRACALDSVASFSFAAIRSRAKR